jgi:hypothetical protein
MLSIPKIISVVLGSFVLCLSLSDASQARHNRGTDPCLDRRAPGIEKCGAGKQQGIRTITGEVRTSMARDFSSNKLTARK